MTALKANLTSMTFGLTWGLFGYIIVGEGALGGLIASPFIGLLIGRIALSAVPYGIGWMFPVSLVNLYIAVFLYGLASGIYDYAVIRADQSVSPVVIIESVFAFLWGLTFLYIIFLYPASLANHAYYRLRYQETNS